MALSYWTVLVPQLAMQSREDSGSFETDLRNLDNGAAAVDGLHLDKQAVMS